MKECNTLHSNDVFRYRGLGKSALTVWEALGNGDANIKELSKITGRSPSTVSRVLNEMSGIFDLQTGEHVRMVEKRDKKWHRLEADLERVALIMGTAGMGNQQRERYIRERERYHQILIKRGKQK